ncbi:SOUL heme-binding protein [Bremerella volcania]|uniref:SOUL heme-binding protein n=1 Tax=Bremerella volcania TaxID=2527984 RepID=A0A518CC58_9BACT|nr:heme-binding protein [Bremerella volcania]QDU76808.1 SOUL heme-binding protein [Bremerella volcania]
MMRLQIVLALTSLAFLGGWSYGRELGEGESSVNTEAAKLISDALIQAKDQSPGARLEIYQLVAKVVRKNCPNNVLIAEKLQAADNADTLEKGLRESFEILTFKMKKEADLPAGFPQPTPVGEIRLKQYPAYRLARTQSRKDSGFFKLLAHITLNRIEMTAPVEMTYTSSEDKSPEQIDMASLYSDAKIGQVGNKLGGVKVEDVPAMTTVCIGLKGEDDRADLAEIERRLEQWLSREAPEYERAGKLRLLGYNSPEVAAKSRYYEVEMPISKK